MLDLVLLCDSVSFTAAGLVDISTRSARRFQSLHPHHQLFSDVHCDGTLRIVLFRVSVVAMSHHDQKQPGEDRVCSAYMSIIAAPY